MTNREETTQQDPESRRTTARPGAGDDRRGVVKPTDNPVPSSPEAEEDAVRQGQEKLERVKPH